MGRFFKYRLKIIFAQRQLLFYTLFFPLILATLFNLAFSNIDNSQILKTIEVGMVNKPEKELVEVMKTAKFGKSKAFKLNYLNAKDAQKQLESKELQGVITFEKDDIILKTTDADMSETILENFLNTYQQTKATITNLVEKNHDLLQSDWFKSLDFSKDNVELLSISEKSNNQMTINFYTVIAMACLFGAQLGVQGIKTLQPTLSYQGARLQVSSYSKTKMIFVDFIVNMLLIFGALLILISYMVFALKVDFSHQITSILFVCWIGSAFAVSYGYLVALLIKKNESLIDSVVYGLTMAWSFLAGMMGATVKYEVEKLFPFAKFLNPVSLITDSFYQLYYYDNLMLIMPNILALSLFLILCLTISMSILRRNQYDYI